MHRFDKKVNLLLNEILGSLAGFAKGFSTGFMDPKAGLKLAASTMAERQKEKRAAKEKPFDLKNKPKIGQFIVYYQDPRIMARIISPMNNKGQFKVQLVSDTARKRSLFSFVRTEKDRRWRIDEDQNISNYKDKIIGQEKVFVVGKGTDFADWIDYNTYIKSSRK